ncbi:unnamed protein product [Cuscuta epithymum]|uniref:Leucine-rich repeat-containing N-terminal plant-type domain-containing protein n=1 Tax=Cuscuta epithymum TaxID=186058 RepID=A0AAV0F2J9_9ASTE|nr:unnamed protein product [Cuscuta epithymum]
MKTDRLLLLWASTMAVGVSCCLMLLATSVASKCVDAEREVLLKFKHNVVDENDYLRSWGNHSDEDCCRGWEGVWCDDATGHVIYIELDYRSLSAKDGGKYSTSLPFFELRYLKHLDLSVNHRLLANQSISSLIGNNTMVYLQYLNLDLTGIVGTIPENFGNTMPAVTHLDLGSNHLEGSIPENFGNNLPALTYLDLIFNLLEGFIPDSLGKMVNLTYLNLQNNRLEGHIPEALGNMSVLEELHLWGNDKLQGEIPKFIWNICTLQVLNLSFNRHSGTLFISTLCANHPLLQLNLEGNRFTGLFPDLTMFPSLATLYLSDNLLGGVISEHHFVTLSKLLELDLSSNNFTFDVSSAWRPPFQLFKIFLRSCNLGPKFPNWLRTQVNFTHLDISNNTISDSIPSWFWNTTTNFVGINISYNGIKGTIGNGAQASIQGGELDISSNQLQGVISPSFFNVTALRLSQNNFTDLNFLCDIKAHAGVELLDFSFNQLSGRLPDCWSTVSHLRFLNLGTNHNLSGTLPTSIGSLASLKVLHLDHNKFTGPLPSSLKNCSLLVSLHLGHNNLFGPIPHWVLDLSMNHISGTLPNCLSNLTQMMKATENSGTMSYDLPYSSSVADNAVEKYTTQEEKIDVTWKGMVYEFGRNLGYLHSIDLSSNMLSGEIPTEITSLFELVSLNLSRNNLTGQIPLRIGNLAKLDVLDLSSNYLSGSIPQSLALIHGMGVLNVSNNNLSGRIPKGTQLQSFNASLYMGNPALCGDPLPNSCAGEESTYPSAHGSSEEEEDNIFGNEFYASMGVGYGAGFLGVLGTMLFNRPCRFAFFKVLDNFANWIYVVVAIHKAKFVRSLGG